MFLNNHTQNLVAKLVPDPFLKSQNWAYLQISSLKIDTASYYCMSSWRLLQYIETKLQTTCIYFIQSFLEKQIGLELVSLRNFLNDFFKKNILLLCSFTWPKFIVWLSLLFEILGNMWIAIVCSSGCDVMNFEINLVFLIKLFSVHN